MATQIRENRATLMLKGNEPVLCGGVDQRRELKTA